MRLIRRQIEMLRTIHENPQWTLKDVSSQLNVSMQTLKNDLVQLQELLAEYNVKVELMPGNKLRLWGQENFNYMLNDFQTMQEFSLEKQIMLLLLLSDDFVVLQDMADALFVSKSLVEKVLRGMMKKYPDELDSARHHGIRNISSQLERRNSFVEIIMPYFSGLDFQQELADFHTNHFPIKDYITEQMCESAAEAIQWLQSCKTVTFTDESITQLFLQMLYVQYVHANWRHVTVGSLFVDMLKGAQDEKLYWQLAAAVCEKLHLPAEEVGYFSYLFMVLRKQKLSNTDSYVEAMQDVMQEILQRIYDQMAIDFRQDETLIKGLSVHIYTTVVRKNRLQTNLMSAEGKGLRQQYPIGTEMAIIAAQVIQERYNYHVSDEEILYMVLHFQAGIERLKHEGQKVKVAVVCHYGMAAANLIAARVEHIFANAEIVHIFSMQAFRSHVEDIKCDLILSTENIPKAKQLPVIYVTPMLPEREIKEIRQFIDMHCFTNMLMLYIMNADILTLPKAASREEVIRLAADKLVSDGNVMAGYADSLLQREHTSSTDLDNIAVPHGNPDLVKETRLLIVRLQKPLHWKFSDVQYVFIFAVSRQDYQEHLGLISNFYKSLVRSNVRLALHGYSRLNNRDFLQELTHLVR